MKKEIKSLLVAIVLFIALETLILMFFSPGIVKEDSNCLCPEGTPVEECTPCNSGFWNSDAWWIFTLVNLIVCIGMYFLFKEILRLEKK